MARWWEGNVNTLLTIFLIFPQILTIKVDSNGYIAYCPCMGRFGNQADHFLGVLGFAKSLNRTLILPPWIEYRRYEAKSIQVPFDTYFKIEPLTRFHNVITMQRFMKYLSPSIWLPENRIVFCYMSRSGSENEDCNAKEGNPFGPFWDHFNIDFVKSMIYSPLHFDIHNHDMAEKWSEKFPPDEYPVLAFSGAPASFPVQLENRDLHQYLQWSDVVDEKASTFIREKLPKGPFIGIHLRNGVDWSRACEHIDKSPNLFSAPQCLGYRNENGVVTKEMCFPSFKTIIQHLKTVINDEKAKSIFVASDDNHMITELNKHFKKLKVEAFRYHDSNPHVDLAILGKSNHMIANCVSSFSAFAVRERRVHNLSHSFWGYPLDGSKRFNDEF